MSTEEPKKKEEANNLDRGLEVSQEDQLVVKQDKWKITPIVFIAMAGIIVIALIGLRAK
jgi:hypothetical protein